MFSLTRLKSSRRWLSKIPRRIPAPRVLRNRIETVVRELGSILDNGEPLLSHEDHENIQKLLKHVDKGCLSDPPEKILPKNFHFLNKRNQLRVARGTSQLEGFHKHLRTLIDQVGHICKSVLLTLRELYSSISCLLLKLTNGSLPQ